MYKFGVCQVVVCVSYKFDVLGGMRIRVFVCGKFVVRALVWGYVFANGFTPFLGMPLFRRVSL